MHDWKDLFDEDQDIVTFDIPGLKLIREALSHEQQMIMVHEIIKSGYFAGAENINQAMCFGKLPPFISSIETLIRENYSDLFPQEITKREPLFDQAILNLYQKGEGIMSHVDLLRFEDGILIVSLLSSCVMRLKPATDTSLSYNKSDYCKNDSYHDLLLRPGDILALSGDARYKWEHGIEERLIDEIDGDLIKRGTRISVTLRKLKEEGCEEQSTIITATR